MPRVQTIAEQVWDARWRGPNRSIIDSLVHGALVDLFAAYGVAAAPLPRLPAYGPLSGTEVSAAVVFTRNGQSLRDAGRLTLTAPAAVLEQMKGQGSGALNRDWVRELANQLTGRIKNRLLHFGVRIQLGGISAVDPTATTQKLAGPTLRVYAGRTLRGLVVTSVEGLPDESELKYVTPAVSANEGDAILF